MKQKTMFLIPTLVAAAWGTLIATTFAQSELLTFDDLSGLEEPIPNGYGGLLWSNFSSYNTVYYAHHGSFNGYNNGVVSQSNVVFSAGGQFSGGLFNLNSAYLMAAWNDGLKVEVQGFAGATMTYDNTYTVGTQGSTLINFNYFDVDKVNFISSGGVPHVGGGFSGGSGTVFGLDNVSITIISNIPPTLSTNVPTVMNAAPAFSGNSVRLWGAVNPNGLPTTVYWEWGTTTAYGTILGQGSGLNGQTLQSIAANISGLSPDTTYHYQLVASNSAGVASSGDNSFTTPAVFEQVFTYSISNNAVTITGYTLTGYSGQAAPLVIPGIIAGLPVVSIGYIAFSGTSLTLLTMPDSVTSIGTEAFADCNALTSLAIPTSITNISASAFWNCTGLTNVTIPGSVKSLGDHVFAGCANLLSATIESTSIGDYEFSGCGNLAGVAIGNTVTTIGAHAFEICTGLTNLTIPDGVATVGESAFASCSGLTEVSIPNTMTNIGSSAFAGCSSLAQVTLPTNLRTVEDSVFSGCSSLLTVTIPNSVTNIGPGAFAYCGSLTNVIIGNGVLNIGSAAFYNCSNLTAVSIPASTLNIAIPDNPRLGSDVVSPFAGCTSLIAINVDPLNSAYSSAGGVLLNKDQSQVLLCPPGKRGNYVIPDSVIVVGDSAFANCSNLANVTIGGSVAELGYHAFDSCVSLTNITIPDSVTNIQDAYAGCFGHCVDGGVFGRCTSLTNVVIGKGLTYLGLGAFTDCSNLLSLYFKGNAPALGFTVVGYEDIFGADSATVYYLPGTTGWGSTLAGLPALLWNPQIQTGDACFGVRLNAFGFNITGTSNIPVVIEAWTNLGAGSRVPLQSCTLTNGLVYFGDPEWTNYRSRFYRIRSP